MFGGERPRDPRHLSVESFSSALCVEAQPRRGGFTLAQGKRSVALGAVAPRQRALKGHFNPERSTFNAQRSTFKWVGRASVSTSRTSSRHFVPTLRHNLYALAQREIMSIMLIMSKNETMKHGQDARATPLRLCVKRTRSHAFSCISCISWLNRNPSRAIPPNLRNL